MVEPPQVKSDVLIVGSGPAGIAAAVTASTAGRRVTLVDDNPFAGGQIWRNAGKTPKGSATRWLQRLHDSKSIERLSQSRVVAPLAGKSLLIETPAGARTIQYQSLILATGARELFLPFPGWTLPGVFGAGAMQALIKSGLPVKDKRVLVAGAGPLLLAVGQLLRKLGATVPMIAEQTSAAAIRRFGVSLIRTPGKLLAGVSLRAQLLGSPYLTDAFVTRVERDGESLQVTLRVQGKERVVPCDYLACGFHLIPNTELAKAMGCALTDDGFVRVSSTLATSSENVYAAGELTGIGGVEKAIIEGQMAALAAIGQDAGLSYLQRQRVNAQGFAARLEKAFALRPELFKLATSDTIVCRCEDVPLSAVGGFLNARDIKLQTRCGMGPCQGRICGPALARLIGVEAPLVRPPIMPTTIRTLATAGAER